jgi:hypothetical protein
MAELLRLFHNYAEDQVRDIMVSLIKKRVPILQKIDNEIVILDKTVSARDSILLILYDSYPKWFEITKLRDLLKKHHTSNNISVSLNNIIDSRLAHVKEGKAIITEAGLAYIQSKFKDKLISSS